MRSKHMAWSVSPAESTPERNTRSSQTIGVEAAVAGQFVHPSDVLRLAPGRRQVRSSLDPLK